MYYTNELDNKSKINYSAEELKKFIKCLQGQSTFKEFRSAELDQTSSVLVRRIYHHLVVNGAIREQLEVEMESKDDRIKSLIRSKNAWKKKYLESK
jgi:hypothetical protein